MDSQRRSKSHRRRVAVPGYAVLCDGPTAMVHCGSGPKLDNIHWSNFTAEGWIRIDSAGGSSQGSWIAKESGWWIVCGWGEAYIYRIEATPDATYSSAAGLYTYGEWFHFALTYDHDGDKRARLWINGVYKSATAPAGEPESDDSGQNLILGWRNTRGLDGAIAWVRLSDIMRYTATFMPPSRDNPPPVDANTIEQWNLDEGCGTVARAQVDSPTNDGALLNGAVWITT